MVIPVTYSGTLMRELRNSREWDTMWMTGRRVADDDVQSGSHKSIAQMNHTKQDDVMSKNGSDERCFRMLQSNSGVYGGPETG